MGINLLRFDINGINGILELSWLTYWSSLFQNMSWFLPIARECLRVRRQAVGALATLGMSASSKWIRYYRFVMWVNLDWLTFLDDWSTILAWIITDASPTLSVLVSGTADNAPARSDQSPSVKWITETSAWATRIINLTCKLNNTGRQSPPHLALTI